MDRVKKNIVGVESAKRELISKRYKRITKAVNSEFWSSNSETAHSLYVGSYGRGTATTDSDLDVLLSLPRSEYERYDMYRGMDNQDYFRLLNPQFPKPTLRLMLRVMVRLSLSVSRME